MKSIILVLSLSISGFAKSEGHKNSEPFLSLLKQEALAKRENHKLKTIYLDTKGPKHYHYVMIQEEDKKRQRLNGWHPIGEGWTFISGFLIDETNDLFKDFLESNDIQKPSEKDRAVFFLKPNYSEFYKLTPLLESEDENLIAWVPQDRMYTLERTCTYKGRRYDNSFSHFTIRDPFYRHIPWFPFGIAAIAKAHHYFVTEAENLENQEMKCLGIFEILQQKTLPEYHILQFGTFVYPIGFSNVYRWQNMPVSGGFSHFNHDR